MKIDILFAFLLSVFFCKKDYGPGSDKIILGLM